MKIGFLIRYFKPGMGGAENNCYYLARELAKDKKNEVSIFCSDKKEGEETMDGIKVYRCKETLNLTYYLAFYPSIVEKLIKTDLDVLHVHGFGFIQNDIAIRKLRYAKTGLKIIGTPHGPFMALKKYNFLFRLLKLIYMPFLRGTLKRYDKIIQVNPYQHKWMTKEYGIPRKKIVFLPNGVTEQAFEKINAARKNELAKKYGLENQFVISYLGRVQKYKGIDQVISILPELIKIKPNLCFLVIGKDVGDAKRLKDIADSLGVSEKVVFAGEVSEKNKLSLLDLSEIFVFPSEWEAFGIVVLEAMARGNAVVSTRTEGGLFLVEENKNGFLFDYQNKKELLNNMEKIIENDKLRNNMQSNNIKKVRGFLWSIIAKNLKSIYKSIK